MMMIGGNWSYIDPFSESLYVLQLRRQYTEDMTECWSLFTKEYCESEKNGEGNGTSSGSAPASLPRPSLPPAAQKKMSWWP